MRDIEKLRKETLKTIKEILENCNNEQTIINCIDWAIKEVADACVKNVLEIKFSDNPKQSDEREKDEKDTD